MNFPTGIGTDGEMTLLEGSCKTAETMSRLRFLAQTSPFAELSPDVAAALAERLTTRDFAAGAMILDEGQSADECYLIREGEVAVLGSAGADGERERGRIGPGGLFGEMALLSDRPRTASVRAASDCQLLVLGRGEFMQAMTADRRLAERVRRADPIPRPAAAGSRRPGVPPDVPRRRGRRHPQGSGGRPLFPPLH